MNGYRPPLDEIRFVLNHVVGLKEITSWPGFEHVSVDLTHGILNEAARFMSEVVIPLDRLGDTRGVVHRDDGSVSLPDEFKTAYDRYVAAGWNAVKSSPEYGGHGFPMVVGIAVQEMLTSACIAFSLCPMLTQSSVLLMEQAATEALKGIFLENLVSGKWTGTMALSEPQAGSDLGAITTRAEPQPDDTWRVFGTKIFTSWGEHDLAENIIHFVIARTPGAPAGTKGVSVFLVPKILPGADGSLGEPNDVTCVSIERKIGIHASPTCVMSFGEGEGAVGYLIGEVNAGMQAMFAMMNNARLSIALEGLAAGERAAQQAAAFAGERRQGNLPGGSSTVIAQHPDVKRMLATMRSTVRAMRALVYDVAARVDVSGHHPDPATARTAAGIGRLLTPVSKAWCTDLGVEMASLGIQIHGGMGYIEETGAGQVWRDARIAPIYEGTNGIQAIDLVMRALPQEGGDISRAYLAEIDAVTEQATGYGGGLALLAVGLGEAAAAFRETTEWMLDAEPMDRLAGATPYLTMFGTVAGARYLTAAAVAAYRSATDCSDDSATVATATDAIATATFFVKQVLPQAAALVPAVIAGAGALESAVPSATFEP